MIEVKNKTKGPIQLIIRSRTGPREFTTVSVPGTGSGKNIYLLEDERKTDYIDRLEKKELISTRTI